MRRYLGVVAALLLMPLSLLAEGGAIEIGTLAELKAFARRVNNGETTLNAVLTADITVSHNVLKYDGTGLRDTQNPPKVMWTSIGLTQDKAYRGTFDGQGHAISGLYGVTSKEYEHPVALFGFLDGATIKNLNILDSYLKGAEDIWTGTIAHSSHGSHISSIASSACVVGLDQACGLVGESDNDVFDLCLVVGHTKSDVAGGTYGIAHTVNSTMNECYTTTDDAEAIRGGGLAYYFNNGITDGTQRWYQRIGIDSAPRNRFIEGGTVYQRYRDCRPLYTNNPDAYYADPHHPYDSDGYCSICGTYSNPVPEQATDGYWELSNVGQLDWLSKYVNAGNTTVKARLVSDILISSNKRLEPMNLFEGTLDGNGFTIKGLRIEGGGASLILTANNAVIKDLNIEYCYFYGTSTAAPLVSTLNNSQIINCRTLKNRLEGTTQSGLVCNISPNSHITNCYSDAPLYITGEESTLVNSYANVTEEQLHSGELAYLLDHNRPEGCDHWYQRIGTDSIPVMSSEPVENGIVYQGFVSCSEMGYTNEADLYPSTPAHRYDKRDICVFCNKYMEPTLSADGYYEIGNPGQLYWWGDYVRADESHRIAKARLMNDINIVDDMPQWVSLIEFNGTIDGQGYAIRGLKAISPNSKYDPSSFILTSTSATIRNLCMANGNFQGSNTAPFVINFNGGSMVNCSSVQNNLKNKIPSYGFVRYFNAGTIEDCFTDQSSLFQDDPIPCTNCFIPENPVWNEDIPLVFGDGSLALRLNKGVTDGTQAWYQRLGVDTYPVAHPIEGGTVYPIVVQCRNIQMGCTNLASESAPAHDTHEGEACRYCAGNTQIRQEDGFYLLYTPYDLLWFADYVNKDESHRASKAKFMNDIDMAGIDWTPIQEFRGELDGQGYAIRHITLYDPNSSVDKPLIITATGDEKTKVNGLIKNIIICDSYIRQDNCPLFIENLTTTRWNDARAYLKNCGALRNSHSSYLVKSSYQSLITGCFSDSRMDPNRRYGENCIEYVTKDGLASGRFTYELNGQVTNGTQAWYQRIGVDTIPVARHLNDGTVYALYTNCNNRTPYEYSNTPRATTDHLMNNGICNKCGVKETPQLVNGYYEIANKGNLLWFVNHVKTAANQTAKAKLICDIDYAAGQYEQWVPIGEFKGIFDGQNYAIKNFTFTVRGSNTAMGFINNLRGGTIRNLYFTDLSYSAPSAYNATRAVFACSIYDGGKIENCGCAVSHVQYSGVSIYLAQNIDNGSMTDCFTSNVFTITTSANENKTERCFCVSEEEISNGALTHWMNGSRDDNPWYQRIGVDPYPVQKVTEGGIVYAISTDCTHAIIGYTNDNTKTSVPHKFNEEGICEYCQGYQEPEWDADYADSYNGRGAYVITNPGNLLWVKENFSGYDRYQDVYKVLNKNLFFAQDIDMSKYNWSSIGMESNVTINGQGHVIRGLKSDQTGKTALVDVCYGNIINLGIEQSHFTGDDHRVTFATELRGRLLYCWSYNNDGAEAMVEWGYSSGSVTSCFSDAGIISGNSTVTPKWSKANVTPIDINCGELTYVLNNGKTDGTQHWYQRLGTDNMPSPVALEGGTVYIVSNSYTGVIDGYTNTNGGEAYHIYDDYDHCTSCGYYKSPDFDLQLGYKISTPKHLIWLAHQPESRYMNVSLVNDIDMSDVPFRPVPSFSGNFDGRGYTIRGLHLEDDTKTAFIMEANNATIHHLCIEDSYFKAPVNASFVKTLNESAALYFCKALNNTHEASYQAGMVYERGLESAIKYCYSDAYIMQGNKMDADMSFCYAHATPEKRMSGELTYNLNGQSAMNCNWYQRLGVDAEPTPREIEGGTVYYRNLTCAEDAEEGYTNYYLEPGDHNYGEDHFCTVCHNGEPAPLGEDGYYELSNDGHLMWFAHYVNLGWEGNDIIKARLMDDITLNPRPSTLDPQLIWTPIGKDAEHPFRGEIDGQGHIITGLWTDDASRDYVGLCGYMDGALIKNVALSKAHLRGRSYVGSFAGYAYDSQISNCRNSDDCSVEAVVAEGIQNSGIHAGGLIGYAAGSTQLESSYNMAAVSGRTGSSVGGLIGMFDVTGRAASVCSYYLEGTAPICWKRNDAQPAPANLSFTHEQQVGGELAYNLNDKKSENVQWYQRLGDDTYPTTSASSQDGTVYPKRETCGGEATYVNFKPTSLIEHNYVMDANPKEGYTHLYGKHCAGCNTVPEKEFVLFNWDGRGNSINVTTKLFGQSTTLYSLPHLTIEADDIPEFNLDKLDAKETMRYTVNDTLFFKRHFVKGELYTLALPVNDVKMTQLNKYGTFYKYDYIDLTHGDPEVKFVKVTSTTLSPNVAYIFKPRQDIDTIVIPMPKNGVEIVGEYKLTNKYDNISDYGLYGTYRQINVPNGAYGYSASTGLLAHLGSTAWMRPFRAFIWLGTEAKSSFRVHLDDEEGEETGIYTIDEEGNLHPADSDSDPIYDLTGRRVTHPLSGHIYIRNGRKFIAK